MWASGRSSADMFERKRSSAQDPEVEKTPSSRSSKKIGFVEFIKKVVDGEYHGRGHYDSSRKSYEIAPFNEKKVRGGENLDKKGHKRSSSHVKPEIPENYAKKPSQSVPCGLENLGNTVSNTF